MSRSRKPFEVSLSEDQRTDLALELGRAIDDAIAARSVQEREVQYWHTLYEQGRTRSRTAGWADAADLTSYLGTQYVDVLRSQIVHSVMVEPVFTVEGYGDSAPKAPFVEEFHQWQLESEGFQQVFARAAHLSLLEPRGVIEVYEDTIKRPVRKVIHAALQLHTDGTALLDAKRRPILQMDQAGRYIEVTDPNVPAAEVEIDSMETVARGPRMRTIPYRDFLELPGHASDKTEVWGYAKRFYRRIDQLKEKAKAGIYDAAAVEAIGTDDERASKTLLTGQPINVASKDGTDLVEKQLYELMILRDLDGKGLRWYVLTLHAFGAPTLLRLQYDDIGKPRYFSLVPFPRPDLTEGYSYLGHKLITIIEEHTAWRNMLADRAAMQLQAPLKKLQGALWDPESEPIGPKAVITVRDMQEVQPMQFPDATAPAIERIRDAERAGERVSGINDASAGVTSENRRTLGEVELITQQSRGRTQEAVKNIQETLEEVAQIRHIMWKRALAEMGQEGLEMPPSVLQGLEMRGVDVLNYLPDRKMTAAMLEGAFRFKPRGSVETADTARQRSDFNQFVMAMSGMARVNPMIAAILQTPQAAKALIEQGVKLFNVQDKQAFLGSDALGIAQQQMQAQQMMATGPMASGGGAPPSLPMAGAAQLPSAMALPMAA